MKTLNRPWGARWTLLVPLLACGCYSKTVDGTSLVIEADFDPALAIDQLTFSGTGSDGGIAFPATLRPQDAGADLTSGQTVRVLLNNVWATDSLEVRVLGLHQGSVVALGSAKSPVIQQGQEADLKVQLDAGTVTTDGGSDAGSCAEGADFPTAFCTATWCWEHPLPMANALLGAWTDDACHVWTVGGAGTALHKVGTTWAGSWPGVVETLSAVWGTADNDVWAVGDCGVIVHWNGSGWQTKQAAVCTGTRTYLSGVWGTSTTNVWAVGFNGTTGVILQWNGSSWTPYTNAGFPPFLSVWFSADNNGWAVGTGGHVWHYDGSNWSEAGTSGSAPLYGVFGFDGNTAFAVGGIDAGNGTPVGVILQQKGNTFGPFDAGPQPPPADLQMPLQALWGTSPSNMIAIGSDVTTDTAIAAIFSSGSWSLLSGPYPYLHALTGAPDGTAWVGGVGGVVYRGPIGTLQLELPEGAVDPTKVHTLNAVSQSGGDAWAGGTSGVVLHRGSDGGWNLYPPPAGTTQVTALWQPAANDVWAAGSSGLLIHTGGDGGWDVPVMAAHTGGTTWYGLSGRDAGLGTLELWLGGQSLNLTRVLLAPPAVPLIQPCSLTFPDGGPVAVSSLNLKGVSATAAGTVFAVGDQGQIVERNGPQILGSCSATLIQSTGLDLKAVWAPSPTDVWVAGAFDTVLHGTASGWVSDAPTTNTDHLTSVAGTTDGNGKARYVWVGGYNGSVVRHDVPAGLWGLREATGQGNNINGLTVAPGGDVLVVGPNASIVHRVP